MDGDVVDNRLPSENELARQIGLSVATIREALRSLEKDSYISKRHGTGNYYHASTLEARMRIDTIMDFGQLLEDDGYQVTVSQSSFLVIPSIQEAETAFEKQLAARHGSMLRYDRLYLADGNPAIATRNYIPASVIDVDPGATRPVGNIIEFLRNNCSRQVSHSIELLVPDIAGKNERRLFGLPAGSPVMRWLETLHACDDAEIAYADVAFNPRYNRLRLLRKWV